MKTVTPGTPGRDAGEHRRSSGGEREAGREEAGERDRDGKKKRRQQP